MTHLSRRSYSLGILIQPVRYVIKLICCRRTNSNDLAAPGAGEWLGDQQIPPPPSTLPSCYRLNGGYASHLISNDYIKLSNPAGAGDPPTLKAVACSGYTSPTILKEQVNKLQLPFAADRLALLSTGGNDLGFSTIARACFTPLFGKCNVEVDNGRTALYANEFSNNFRDLLRGILDKPRFFCPQQTARSCNTAIYQTSCKSLHFLLEAETNAKLVWLS